MKFGDIFKAIVGEDSTHMSLETIEKKAIKKTSFKRYGKNLVISRDNIFTNKLFNVDKKFDKKIASYG